MNDATAPTTVPLTPSMRMLYQDVARANASFAVVARPSFVVHTEATVEFPDDAQPWRLVVHANVPFQPPFIYRGDVRVQSYDGMYVAMSPMDWLLMVRKHFTAL